MQITALRADVNDYQQMWYLDSGATSHFCRESNSLAEIFNSGHAQLNLANNASTEIKARGTAIFTTNVIEKQSNIRLKDTLHVPDLRTNLISVSKITDNGHDVIFKKDIATITDRNGDVKMIAKRRGGLYYVHQNSPHECNNASELSEKESKSLRLWHNRLGL